MADFAPVEMTNGIEQRTAATPYDLVQLQYDGWVPVGSTYSPPLPDGSPGPAVPTTGDFITMMSETFVRKDDLVINNQPPATPKGPGTVFIDNTVT